MPNREQRRNAMKNAAGKGAIIHNTYTSYSGPMPAPEDMLRYKECFPELPERIVRLAEESSRRETMKVENQSKLVENQRLVANLNASIQRLGLIFAFLLALICLGSAAYFVINGFEIAAFVAAIPPVSMLVKAIFKKQ